MLNKFQAAAFLGVSPSEIDKFVADGRLHVVYIGIVPFFSQEELISLKNELGAQSQPTDLQSLLDSFRLVEKIVDAFRSSKSDDPYKGAYTLQGASSVYGLSITTLRKDIKEGKLKAAKVGGFVRIKRKDLAAYFKKEWGK
jgi:excisionase family DNA binding protein